MLVAKNDVLAQTNAQWQGKLEADPNFQDTFDGDGDLASQGLRLDTMHMTGADFHKKTEAQAQRLIHSVNAVTDLLKANTELRDQNEKINRELEDKEAENGQLQFENQQLRERLELVESILRNNSH